MKVAELIQKLSRMNPDAEVVFPTGEHDDLSTPKYVAYNPENPKEVVIDDSGYRWDVSYPCPYREPSAADLMIKQITEHSFKMLAESLLKDYAQEYKSNVALNTTLRIRMPEMK